jgi:glycosyltransferase involved in cell wall biosynthesis
VVWFDIHFLSFGFRHVPSFLGNLTPMLVRRLLRVPVVVTLHDFLECVDVERLRVPCSPLVRAGARMATAALMGADRVVVLLPSYRSLLACKYRAPHVTCIPHGALGRIDAAPSRSDANEVLVFGKFGGAKRLDTVLRAYQHLTRSSPAARLHIAGTDHPRHPGYMASFATLHGSVPGVGFSTYVPEERVPETFRRASVVALPHSTSTGYSGVLVLACMHGTPVVAPDLPTFREIAAEDGLALALYEPENAAALAASLEPFISSAELRLQVGAHNIAAMRRQSAEVLADRYAGLFREVLQHWGREGP